MKQLDKKYKERNTFLADLYFFIMPLYRFLGADPFQRGDTYSPRALNPLAFVKDLPEDIEAFLVLPAMCLKFSSTSSQVTIKASCAFVVCGTIALVAMKERYCVEVEGRAERRDLYDFFFENFK